MDRCGQEKSRTNELTLSGSGIIDHIFFRNASGVKRWGVISDIWNGRFASDHFPVLAEIVLDRR